MGQQLSQQPMLSLLQKLRLLSSLVLIMPRIITSVLILKPAVTFILMVLMDLVFWISLIQEVVLSKPLSVPLVTILVIHVVNFHLIPMKTNNLSTNQNVGEEMTWGLVFESTAR